MEGCELAERVPIEDLTNHFGQARSPWWGRDPKNCDFSAIEHRVHRPSRRCRVLIGVYRLDRGARSVRPSVELVGNTDNLLGKTVPAGGAVTGEMEGSPI